MTMSWDGDNPELKRSHNHYDECACGKRKQAKADICLTCYLASKPLAKRFWEKVNLNGPIPACRPDLGPCWIWTGSIGSHGYGHIKVGHSAELITAPHACLRIHSVSVPEGYVPDHLCKVRACVRLSHLEIVPDAVNSLRGESPAAKNSRKTHCNHGHEFSEENTRVWREHRYCRICIRRRRRLAKEKKAHAKVQWLA